MFESIRALAAKWLGSAPNDLFEPNDYRLAAAVLLVHVAGADGVVVNAETQRIHALLTTGFKLDDETADQLLRQAAASDGQSGEWLDFATGLKHRLDPAARQRIVEMLWDVAGADGSVHEFESTMILRVAELLQVDAHEPASGEASATTSGPTPSPSLTR